MDEMTLKDGVKIGIGMALGWGLTSFLLDAIKFGLWVMTR